MPITRERRSQHPSNQWTMAPGCKGAEFWIIRMLRVVFSLAVVWIPVVPVIFAGEYRISLFEMSSPVSLFWVKRINLWSMNACRMFGNEIVIFLFTFCQLWYEWLIRHCAWNSSVVWVTYTHRVMVVFPSQVTPLVVVSVSRNLNCGSAACKISFLLFLLKLSEWLQCH